MPKYFENTQVQGKYSYTIGPEIGLGTFGAVHRARRRDGLDCAMKIALVSQDPLEAFTFAQEAYKTHDLKHRNIIPIDDLHFFELQGVQYFFFTMPLANRGSLRSFAPRGTTVDPETGVPLLSQAAVGIHYGHTQKVVHRDVKPENILLDERENPSQPGTTYLHVLVSDFGISVWAHNETSFVKQGTGGTLPYMAPEQFEGQPRPESDQYGLAVVAHELFTGQRPYAVRREEGLDSIQQIMRFKQLHQDAPIPPFGENVLQRNPDLFREVEKIVKKGMSKNPGERYASTQLFGQALQKALTDYLARTEAGRPQNTVHEALKVDTQAGTVPAPKPTASPVVPTPQITPAPQVRVNPGYAQPAFYPPDQQTGQPVQDTLPVLKREGEEPESRGSQQDSVARQQGKNTSKYQPEVINEMFNQFFAMPVPDAASVQPPVLERQQMKLPRMTRRRTLALLIAGGVTIGGGGIVALEKVLNPEISPGATLENYRGHTQAVDSVTWSPNGEYIASGSADKTIQVWNAQTGKLLTTYNGHSGSIYSVTWSPDGSKVLSIAWDNTVQEWNAKTGELLSEYKGNPGTGYVAAFVPAGSKYTASGFDYKLNSVHVGNYKNGASGGLNQIAISPDGSKVAVGLNDSIQVVDYDTTKVLLSYNGHSGLTNALTWSPDNRKIAAGSDNTVLVLDVATGELIIKYAEHSNTVETLAWSPNGKYIASGSYDKTVRVWEV